MSYNVFIRISFAGRLRNVYILMYFRVNQITFSLFFFENEFLSLGILSLAHFRKSKTKIFEDTLLRCMRKISINGMMLKTKQSIPAGFSVGIIGFWGGVI